MCNVQQMWNVYENWIAKACDLAAPLVDSKLQKDNSNCAVPPQVKNLLNKRKRLLRKQKFNFEIDTQVVWDTKVL